MSSLGRPIQIVQISEDHEYILDEAALKSILLQENIKDKPLVVLSIAGAFRKGKSFLLNFLLHTMKLKGDLSFLRKSEGSLLNGEQGFNWKRGVDRVTCGIVIWSEAFLAQTPSGEEVAVIFMDTQGMFDSKSTTQDNVFIFALGTMISSVQIFNIFNNIEEVHLQHLQLFTEFGRLVAEKNAKMGKGSAAPFQKLLFLVRDWYNPQDHAYGYEGGEKYLESWLKVTGNEHQELRGVRTNIKRCFTELSCFLMPEPGKEIKMNSSSQFKLSDLDNMDEFKNQLHNFIAKFLSPENLIPTKIGGNSLRASDLPQYFKMFVRMFNNKEVPAASNIYEATADVHNRAMADQCLREFRSEPITGTRVEEIVKGNSAKEKKALESFGEKCMESENSNLIRENLAANLEAEVKLAIEDFEVKAEAHNKNLAEGFIEDYRSNPPFGKSVDEVTKGHVQKKTDILDQFKKQCLRNSSVETMTAKLVQDLEKVKLEALKEYERAANEINKSLVEKCMRQYRKNVSSAGTTAFEIEKCHREQNDKTMEYFDQECMCNSKLDSLRNNLEDDMEAAKKTALQEFEETSNAKNKSLAEKLIRKFKSLSFENESASGLSRKKEEMLLTYDRESIVNGNKGKIRDELFDELGSILASEIQKAEAAANTYNRNVVDECVKKYRNQYCSGSIEEMAEGKEKVLKYFNEQCKQRGDIQKYRSVMEDELEGEKKRATMEYNAAAEIHNRDVFAECMAMYKDGKSGIPILSGLIDAKNFSELKDKVTDYYRENCKEINNDSQQKKLDQFLSDEEGDTPMRIFDVPTMGLNRVLFPKRH